MVMTRGAATIPRLQPSSRWRKKGHKMTIVADTPQTIERFRAIVLKQAIKIRLEHNIQVNRAYTPRNMVLVAERITGAKCLGKTWRAKLQSALNALEAIL